MSPEPAPVTRTGTELYRPAPRVLVSGLVSDSHTWNLVYLQLLLEDMGCAVENLGACVSPDLLVATCRRVRPDMVVLSSVNGHGYFDASAAIRSLRDDPALAVVPVVIGGKLGISGRDPQRDARLLADGFSAVFGDAPSDGVLLASCVRELRTGLAS
jgi:methylaspartate mutase sigma subunit